MKSFFGSKSPCLALCNRWMYPVFSASYGKIQYQNDDIENQELANRSWSRIRVVMPESSRIHAEDKQQPYGYLAACDVSRIMGVYAGFSMITFVQVLAYGAYILWRKWKERRNLEQNSQKTQKRDGLSSSATLAQHKMKTGLPPFHSHFRKKIGSKNSRKLVKQVTTTL